MWKIVFHWNWLTYMLFADLDNYSVSLHYELPSKAIFESQEIFGFAYVAKL